MTDTTETSAAAGAHGTTEAAETATAGQAAGAATARTIAVHVRYYASARAAAGTEAETLDLPEGADLAAALDAIRAQHDAALARVLTAASFLLDEVAVRRHSAPLHDGARLDVLPPFAGG
ncbi:MoaD/ThiS family protein [Haloechinothrix salitolerans]|uniref:MoaD/ThiS family protein n=1 Tax=Haloechinothrix salitolerans TaxID=926830 RepID=A0ABW2BUL2_9PSEU